MALKVETDRRGEESDRTIFRLLKPQSKEEWTMYNSTSLNRRNYITPVTAF